MHEVLNHRKHTHLRVECKGLGFTTRVCQRTMQGTIPYFSNESWNIIQRSWMELRIEAIREQ
jgi:hypothetical protein